MLDARRIRGAHLLPYLRNVDDDRLDENGQVDFKGKAKTLLRTHGFLAAILPYTNAAWEKLSIFLNLLVSKLPAPREEDLSKDSWQVYDGASLARPRLIAA